MILYCFGIRDRATNSFDRPMFFVSQGQANRAFADEVNREAADNQLFKHSDDFDLYLLASFDSDTGIFTCEQPIRMVAVGKELVLKK